MRGIERSPRSRKSVQYPFQPMSWIATHWSPSASWIGVLIAVAMLMECPRLFSRDSTSNNSSKNLGNFDAS